MLYKRSHSSPHRAVTGEAFIRLFLGLHQRFKSLTNCTSARCRVWAEIDLNAVAQNFRHTQNHLGEEVKVLVVVKANAYGLGAVPIARRLAAEGAFGFGVGDSEEALELRDAGITEPILILGAIIEGEMANVVARDISTCIHSSHRISRLEAEARFQGKVAKVHLMVDTGMARLGAGPRKAVELAQRIHTSSYLSLEGVCTHFSSGYASDPSFSQLQLRKYASFLEDLRVQGIEPGLRHGPNSGAIFQFPESKFNLARPGIAIYGLDPGGFFECRASLSPVLSFRTSVIYLRDVPEGTPIGYNRTYTTKCRTRVATLPVGYNDGYSYRLSNCAHVLVRGKRAPVIGSVCMDYTMVDVGGIPDVQPGDPVTLIGKDGDDEITVNDLARLIGTIPYEVTCQLGKRVQRIAVQRSEPGPLGSPSSGSKLTMRRIRAHDPAAPHPNPFSARRRP